MLPLVLPLTNPWLLLGAVWRGNRETLKVTAKKNVISLQKSDRQPKEQLDGIPYLRNAEAGSLGAGR